MQCWCWGTNNMLEFCRVGCCLSGSKWIHILFETLIILLHLEASKCGVLTVIYIHYRWINCFSPFTTKSFSKVYKFEDAQWNRNENATSFQVGSQRLTFLQEIFYNAGFGHKPYKFWNLIGGTHRADLDLRVSLYKQVSEISI